MTTETMASPIDISPDREAAVLAEQILELHAKVEEADRFADNLWSLYEERSRERPEALYPIRRDGMIPGVTFEQDDRLREERLKRLPGRIYDRWCHVEDIDALRKFAEGPAPIEKEFIGSKMQWNAFCADCNERKRANPDEWDKTFEYDPRLWADVPDTEIHERAAEILKAWVPYSEGLDQYYDELGYDAALDRIEDLSKEKRSLCERLLSIKTTTREGAQVKASVVLQMCWRGQAPKAETSEQLLLRSIVSDLTGVDLEDNCVEA